MQQLILTKRRKKEFGEPAVAWWWIDSLTRHKSTFTVSATGESCPPVLTGVDNVGGLRMAAELSPGAHCDNTCGVRAWKFDYAGAAS